jgi:hypothetical protein
MSQITFPVLVQGGLAILATSVWSETGKKIINEYYPYGRESILANLIYAIIITVAIIITIWLVQNITSIDYSEHGVKIVETIGQRGLQ